MTITTDLIDALEERRKADGLTDSQFAEQLGISRTSWWWMRTRRRQPSRAILAAIVQAYPEYTPLVTLFLRGDVSDNDSRVSHTGNGKDETNDR